MNRKRKNGKRSRQSTQGIQRNLWDNVWHSVQLATTTGTTSSLHLMSVFITQICFSVTYLHAASRKYGPLLISKHFICRIHSVMCSFFLHLWQNSEIHCFVYGQMASNTNKGLMRNKLTNYSRAFRHVHTLLCGGLCRWELTLCSITRMRVLCCACPSLNSVPVFTRSKESRTVMESVNAALHKGKETDADKSF